MKLKAKILTLVLVLATLISIIGVFAIPASAATITGGTKLYLKPNSNWTQSNARFAAYFCNGESSATWVSMTSVADGIYEVTVPADQSHANVIFCRMNPSTTANNWNNKWNQSGDLTWNGTDNLCTINDGQWDCGTNVTWSKIANIANTLSNKSSILFLTPNSNWTQADARFAAYFYDNNSSTWLDMEDSNGDGTYEVNVPSGYTGVIFCRMNPSTTANDWVNKWNQTNDITLSDSTNDNKVSILDGWWSIGESSHIHIGGKATCTEKATCTVCGQSYGETLDHSFGDITPSKSATCISDGNLAYKQCSKCNLYYAGDAGNKATGGVEELSTSNFLTSATGTHIYSEDWTFDSVNKKHYHACTADNNCTAKSDEAGCVGSNGGDCTKDTVCGTCNSVLVLANESHTARADDDDCTTAVYCSNTDCTQITTSSSTHSFTEKLENSDHFRADGANCQTGDTYWYNCDNDNCNVKSDTLYYTSTSSFGPHSVDAETWVKTETQHYHKCTVEGCTYTEDVASHSLATAVEENRIEATCTVNGSYDSVVYCTECDEELSRTPQTITAPGHNFVDGECTNCEAKGVAKIGETYYLSLQEAVDAVQNGDTVVLVSDCAEVITFTQTKDVSFVLDGNGKTYTGSINITARAGKDAASTLVIKNFNFSTTQTTHTFISSSEKNYYPNNITVSGCSFEGTGSGSVVVPVNIKSANNFVMENCTANNVHSLLQNGGGGWDYTIRNCTVTNAGRGMNLHSVQGALVENVTIEASAEKYGIRVDAAYADTLTIKDCTISAFIPVCVRKASANYTIAFEGENTMTAANTDGYWCVIGDDEYEENGGLPTTVTGKVIVKLNGTGLDEAGIYGNYKAIAKIGETYYDNLQDAVNAGGEIVLLKDVTLTETLDINKTVTIDMDTNVLTSTATVAIKITESNVSLTVNGKIVLANSNSLARSGDVAVAQTVLTMGDVTNVTAILNAEFTLGAEDVIYSGEVDNITLKVLDDYATHLAQYGYITSESDGTHVQVIGKSDYYIGANGNWYIGGIDTGISAKGVTIKEYNKTSDGLKDTYLITFSDGNTVEIIVNNGKSAYDLAVENGYEGTLTEWLASLAGEAGAKGDTGATGAAGKSAYELAVENGYKGTEEEWLESLIGEKGDTGATGAAGKSAYELAVEAGFKGTLAEWLDSLVGKDGVDGSDGANGKSAYELAVEAGFEGTLTEWLASLVGASGKDGADGSDGSDGADGKSAYELAVENGYKGTLTEWLASLVGEAGADGSDGADGANGKSAYELAVENGYEGTESEWLASLVGANGKDGTNGKSAYELAVENGYKGDLQTWLASLVGADGKDGTDGSDGADGANGKSAYELAVELGYKGTEAEWIASLAGKDGEDGKDGIDGANGKSAYELAVEAGFKGTLAEWLDSLVGKDGVDGSDGADGANGKSAYELAVEAGFEGTLTEWLASLVGDDGKDGADGSNGADGATGKSAYELAVEKGYTGTLQEWLASLVGAKGDKGDTGATGAAGKSAYELAVEKGYKGTEAEWLASLAGTKGDKGDKGEDGDSPYIGENGNWWVGETDTGFPATGDDGHTPEITIGENGNWFIDGVDTGKKAEGKDGNDNNKIIIICIGIAALCIMTTIVAVSTKRFRRPWWILC